jgi:hypothetical protein
VDASPVNAGADRLWGGGGLNGHSFGGCFGDAVCGELQQRIPFSQCFGFYRQEHLHEYVHQQLPIGNRRYRSLTEVETFSNEKKEMDILKSRRTNSCFFV